MAMNIAVWILQALVAQLVASTIDAFCRKEQPDKAAKIFNSQVVAFNSKLPKVLDKVLLAAYPELRDVVLTVKSDGKQRSVPVVPLLSADENNAEGQFLTISSAISGQRDTSIHDENLIAFIKDTGRTIWDNEVFRLIAIGRQRELIFGLTRFFKVLTSCDRFLYELVCRFPRKPSDFRLAVLRRSKLLRRWKQDVDKVVRLHRFDHLSAAVGISVFTVFKCSGKEGDVDYRYPCIENSNQKNGACDRHVIPSFIYEPFMNSPEYQVKELELEYQVLREFGEEILGINGLRSPLHWEAVYGALFKNEACKSLHALLENGGATLRVTGLWLDLLRLRPEISCALVIDDTDFFRKHVQSFMGSWENNPGVTWGRLTSLRDYKDLLMNEAVPMCPPGAAALVSGRTFALRYLGLDKKVGERYEST